MANISRKQPQTVFQVVGNGYRLWIQTFSKAFPFALLVGVLNVCLQLGMARYTNLYADASTVDQQAVVAADSAGFSGALLLSTLAFTIISLILHAGMAYRINAAANETEVAFDQAFYVGCKKAFSLMGVYFLNFVAIMIGFILLIAPGFVVAVFMVFSYLIVVITDKSAMESVRESFRLVSGNFWRVIGCFILMTLVYIAIALLLGLAIGLIGVVAGSLMDSEVRNAHFAQYGGIVVMGVGFTILYPLFTTFLLAILYDLQNRKAIEEKDKKPTHRIAA
jgi:hypothetical protein